MSIQTGPFPPSTQASKVISNISIEGTRRALLKFTDGTYCQLDGWALDRVLEASAPKVDSKTPDAVSPAPPSPVDNPFSKVLRDATTSAIAAVIQGPEAAPFDPVSYSLKFGVSKSPASSPTEFRKISESKSEDRPVPPVPHVGWRERHERDAAKSVAEKPTSLSSTLVEEWRQEWRELVRGVETDIFSDWTQFLTRQVETYFAEPRSSKKSKPSPTGDVVYHKEVTPDGRIVDALPLQKGSQTQEWKYVAPDRSLEFRVSSLENRIPYILKTASEFGDLRKRLSALEAQINPQEEGSSFPSYRAVVREAHDRISKLEALSNELATRLLTLEYKASTKTEPSVPQITAERLVGFLDDVMDHIKRSFRESK